MAFRSGEIGDQAGRDCRLVVTARSRPNLKDERGNTALIECAWDAEAALVLVKHGANVNAQSNEGLTPLMNTAAVDVAHVLIDNGADLFLRDKEGKTCPRTREAVWRKREDSLTGGCPSSEIIHLPKVTIPAIAPAYSMSG